MSDARLDIGMDLSKARIELIWGPMWSGKTAEFLRRLRKYTVANKRAIAIKYIKDTRYSSDKICTHEGDMMAAIPCDKNLMSLLNTNRLDVTSFDVIGIDEGQFIAEKGKVVIVNALDGTFERKPFGKISDLVPYAADVTKLNAVCFHCFAPAPFSRRITEDTQVEIIGTKGVYEAVCWLHHNIPGWRKEIYS